MKKKSLLALGFALLAGAAIAADSPLELALRQRKQGLFEDSILTLQRQLKAEPKNSWAWYELGLTYATDSQYGKAVDAYRLAISYGFEGGQCRCALGLALRETHKPAAALAEAKRCLEMMHGYAGAWNLVGNAEIDLGHFDEALHAYQKAVELSPLYSNAHFNLGLVLEALGREAEAEASFKQAVALQASMAEGWNRLGECQLRQKRVKQAVATFKQALRLSPQDADSEWGLSRAYKALGNRKASDKHKLAYKRLAREADRRSAALESQASRRMALEGQNIEAWDKDARERN